MALFCADPVQIVSAESHHMRTEKASPRLFATTVAQCSTASCSPPPWLKECSSRKKVTTCAPKKPQRLFATTVAQCRSTSCSPPLWLKKFVSEESHNLCTEKASPRLFASTVAQRMTASASPQPWLKDCALLHGASWSGSLSPMLPHEQHIESLCVCPGPLAYPS